MTTTATPPRERVRRGRGGGGEAWRVIVLNDDHFSTSVGNAKVDWGLTAHLSGKLVPGRFLAVHVSAVAHEGDGSSGPTGDCARYAASKTSQLGNEGNQSGS